MWVWKKRIAPTVGRGLQQCTLQGASRKELLQEALAEMVGSGGADRYGVWLESAATDRFSQDSVFHGIVWSDEGDEAPREWQTLAPQTVLPSARLLSGFAIEMDLTGDATQPLVGPLAGLRTALWVPVQHAGKLRGILLAGANGTRKELPKERLLEISAELAIALAFETERKIAGERYADLALCGKVLACLQTQDSLRALLQEVVESCVTHAARPHPVGAFFASIARVTGETEGAGQTRVSLEVFSEAGNSNGRQTAALESVTTLAWRAVEGGRTVGAEVRPATLEETVRMVAVPIVVSQNARHVLLAAFLPAQASLAALERLELRRILAMTILLAIQERDTHALETQRRKAILEVSADPIVLLDSRGTIADSNRAARTLLLSMPTGSGDDSTAREFPLSPGKSFPEFFRMRDREKVSAWQREMHAPGSARSYDSPVVELDSGVLLKLHSQEAGESFHAVSLLSSQRVLSNEENRAEVELLNLAEWLDQGVVLYDAHGNVRLLNLRFAQLAGLAPEEVEKYKTLDALIERLEEQSANPEIFARHWRELAQRAAGGEREEVNFVRPAARVLERASRPVLDAAGNQLGRIELYKDLTAQRVFQAKLLQTERLAALGQMVSGVAHELSNPLTSILGYAQRLLLRLDTEGNFEEIRKIFGEAERAGAILRRMLLAARETAPDRRVVSLNQIVQRTIELQRFSLAAERIRVDVSLDATLQNVLGDAGQLQQVLINLMGNARQAIEAQGHGGTIRVRTWRTQDERVRLEISDSGPGIPEGIMARIFDPFFTTKPAGVGTGLGLSIVLSLVREHGGQVSVSSPHGSGAIFLVELPSAEQKSVPERVVQRTAAPQRALTQETASAVPARRPTGTQRVLVVEDEPTVAQLISDVLHDEGFEIEVLLDGRDAVQRASREKFDLIICDMKMPNLDGQSLYDSLALDKKFGQRRFLFVTGDVLGAKTHDFLAKHQLPHVAKPFRVEELLEKVHQVLQPAAGVSVRRVTTLRKNSATTG